MSDPSCDNPKTLPISAVIIAFNEGHRIADCLASLSFCAEILVVDSHSSDDTVSVCRKMGARVEQQSWLGFGPQKQSGIERAQYDWVLCLDADEQISDELNNAIAQLWQQGGPTQPAYQFARCNRFLGRWLRHGEGYPDYSLRLFDRRQGRWSDDSVHEKVLCSGPIGTLSGDLWHRSQETIGSYLNKQNRYTDLQAEQLFERGKRASTAKLILSPLLRFIKFYFLKRGFLDGRAGLIHIAIGCFNSFCKYAKLLDKQLAQKSSAQAVNNKGPE